jgi:hypothetical protein
MKQAKAVELINLSVSKIETASLRATSTVYKRVKIRRCWELDLAGAFI